MRAHSPLLTCIIPLYDLESVVVPVHILRFICPGKLLHKVSMTEKLDRINVKCGLVA